MSSRRDAEDWRGFRRPLALSSDSNERTSLTPAEVCFREAKRTSLLRALTSVFDPHLSNGVVLWNSANAANSLAWRETASAGAKLGVKLRAHEVRSAKNFGNAFRQIVEQHPEVLLVVQDTLTLEYRKGNLEFALPGMFVGKEWVEEGGLMSYGDRLPERYRRAADLVDKVLKRHQARRSAG